MSLRSKIVLLLLAVVLAYAGLDHLLQRALVYKSFVDLEESVAKKDIQRVNDGIRAEIDRLALDCEGWAGSRDLRRVVSVLDMAAFERVFPEDKFQSDTLHVVCVCDTKGTILHSRVHDGDRHVDVTMKGFAVGDSLVDEALISAAEPKPFAIRGLMDTERSLLLVASHPILPGTGADATGKPIGTLVVGRFLSTVAEAISARVGVGFEAISSSQTSARAGAEEYYAQSSDSGAPALVEVHSERLDAYWCYTDLRGKPSALMHAAFSRPITAKGSVAVRYALVSTIAAGLLLMLVLLNLVQRTVLLPLGELTAHAVAIGRSEDFTKRIRSDREDEVGILAREFDGMIERVAESRAALVDTARAAGMSEIATGVLHNVGNVLNSVNVSARIAMDKARGPATGDLRMVMDTLQPEAHDLGNFIQNDPRGKHLFPLLDSLSTKLIDERAILTQELEALSEGIDHIKQLVQSQQGYAGRIGVLETVSLATLIDTALSITSKAASGPDDIVVERDFASLDAVSIDRHRVMEILVNLIQNARQSVIESRVEPARLIIRLKDLSFDRVRIEVTDNGVGIEPENLARIFTHGFTTKKNGHGFGLHASANAATEMGGSLSARSEGKGLGATFVLELPIKTQELAQVSS